uniref:Uncharacterized protein n=1 Tax=Anguilla anguilla TaxID=7936 RepID=A0A0E9W336_ANGAN
MSLFQVLVSLTFCLDFLI